MKIALIHSYLIGRGGSQRYVIEIANTLKQLGIEVDIFCYVYNKNTCYPELTKNLNIQKIFAKEPKVYKPPPKKSILKIFNKVKESFIYGLGLDYLKSLYFTKKRAKDISKLIIKQNKKYNLIFTHEEPLSVWAAIEYKKKIYIPIYWFCYDTLEKWFLEWDERHKRSKLRKFLLRNIYFKYDKFIIRKHIDIIAVLDNIMSKRVERLYNIKPLIRRGGVPENILNYKRQNYFREKYNLALDTTIIFSLSRFANYKRIHDIFEMFTQLPKDIAQKVFVYINSPITDLKYYEFCMEKYKKYLNFSNIKLDLSYLINDDKMYEMYLSSDIFIFPNENQTWGNAPLEAMACGATVIVSNGCGIHEVIKTITPDTVYDVGDIKSLVNKVTRIIKNNKSEIQKNYVMNNLTWRMICEQYIKDFNKLLELCAESTVP